METVISPINIVIKTTNTFDSWQYNSSFKISSRVLKIYSELGLNSVTVPLLMKNKIWFMKQPMHSKVHHTAVVNQCHIVHRAHINATKAHTQYNLWHSCLGHPGHSSTASLHKVTTGSLPLKK